MATKPKRKTDWFDEFFGGLYSQVFARQFDERQSRGQVRIVRRLLGLRRGQRVLDVPCGLGRLTLPLARAGLKMTGVDLTEAYLARARRRARRDGVEARFIHGDMRDVAFDAEFEAAFNWFGSFGYFSEADNLVFAERLLRALRPGGRVLIEGVNRTWLAGHFIPRSEATIGGVHVTYRNRWDARTGRVRAEWTFRKGRKIEPRKLSIRIYSGPEMRRLMRAAGFRDIRLFGLDRLTGGEMPGRLTRHSRRLLAVARRPSRRTK